MSNAPTLLIDAVVAESERPALLAAAEQLQESLLAASGDAWKVAVEFSSSLAAVADVAGRDAPAIVVASLLPDLARDHEPLAATEARWRNGLAALAANGSAAVFLCTIFRRPDAAASEIESPSAAGLARLSAANETPALRAAVLERIRRLNLLAIALSHATGAGVIDIDRLFAHLGARALGTNHRLTGSLAAEVAAYAIVSSILGFGLDDLIVPEVQEQARRFQGAPWDVGRFAAQRVAQRR